MKAALSLLLLPLLTAGCLSGAGNGGQVPSGAPVEAPDGDATAVHLPVPHIGDRAVYTGPDRATLVVEVNGTGSRLDPWLISRESVIVSWRFERSAGDTSFWFEEAIDPATGTVVQQVAVCGMPTGTGQGAECTDDRALVLLSAHGVPGGFGAAPFWGERLDETVAVRVPGPLPAQNATLTTQFSEASPDPFKALLPEGTCLRTQVEAEEAHMYRVLEFTGGLAGFTVCQDLAFPAVFEAVNGDRYELDTFHAGQDDPVPWNGTAEPRSPASRGPGPIPLVGRSAPLLVAHPEMESNLTVGQAHRQALELSQAYADLFEADREPVVVSTHLAQPRSSAGTLELSTSGEFERSLLAIDARGQAVDVTIHMREVHGPLGTERTYELVSEETGTFDRFPTRATLSDRSADVRQSIALAEELSGHPMLPSLGYGLWTTLQTPSWTVDQDRTGRMDGPSVVVWLDELEADDSRRGQGRLISPYRFVADGPTGTVLWIDVPRDRLPLG